MGKRKSNTPPKVHEYENAHFKKSNSTDKTEKSEETKFEEAAGSEDIPYESAGSKETNEVQESPLNENHGYEHDERSDSSLREAKADSVGSEGTKSDDEEGSTSSEDVEKRSHGTYTISLLGILFLIALMVSLGIGQWITTDQSYGVEGPLLKFFISLFFLGMSVIIIIYMNQPKQCCSKSCACCSKQPEVAESRKIWTQIKNNLEDDVVGICVTIILILLFFAMIAMNVTEVIAYAECSGEFETFDLIMTITLPILLIFYSGCLILYHMYFWHGKLEATKTNYACLVGLIASTFWIGFDAQLHEAHEVFVDSYRDQNCTEINYEDNLDCVCETTSAFIALNEMSHYIYPCQVEFCLLIEEKLLSLFFTMGNAIEKQEQKKQKQTKSECCGRPNCSKDCIKPIGYSVLSGLIIFCVLCQILYAYGVHNSVLAHYLPRMSAWVILSLVCGWQMWKQRPLTSKQYNKFEMAIIVASLGNFLHTCFSLVASFAPVYDFEYPVYSVGLFLDLCLNTIQTVLQTIYLTAPIKNIDESIICVLVSNVAIYISDSVAEVKFYERLNPKQLEYYGESWITITHLTFPISLFFRISSCLLCLEIVMHYRIQLFKCCNRRNMNVSTNENTPGDNVSA